MCRKALDNEFCEAKPVLKTAQDVQFSNKLDAEAHGSNGAVNFGVEFV